MDFPHGARPTCVDLFAGAGGMSLGFEQAGFDVIAAVESDPVHCAVHKRNFPGTAVICDSVERVTGRDIRDVSGIGTKPVNAVVGGSPCQGFSMIGKRSLDDPRNALVRHFMRIVAELGADYFCFENVKGLTVGAHRAFLDEIVEGFDRLGYDVLLPWQVLDASSYGVPQRRERFFLLGTRRGLSLPSYPRRTTNAPKARRPVPGLHPGPTVWDALSDIPDAEIYPELASSDEVTAGYGVPSPYAAALRGLIDDPLDLSARRPHDPGRLTSSARADHTETTRARFRSTVPGQVEPVSRFLRLDPDGVCNTLRAGTGKERGAFTAARPIHPIHARCITVREMARLHSYPDWFRFHRTKWHGAREVGNSVPPLLARAVASELVRALGAAPCRAADTGPLDDTLLTVDASGASTRFGRIPGRP